MKQEPHKLEFQIFLSRLLSIAVWAGSRTVNTPPSQCIERGGNFGFDTIKRKSRPVHAYNMIKPIIPEKLKSGETIRIIAPARSLCIIAHDQRIIAIKRFEELGLQVTFGKHVEENDEFTSSSVKSRIEDLHDAFSDKAVKGIFTVIGGFNSNQLLSYIDWKLIKNNPKILCGYSDITALSNAILAKTGLVTYSGPHFSTLGQRYELEYTIEYLKKCCFSKNSFMVEQSNTWTDDDWWIDQEKRKVRKNNGWLVINEGKAEGAIIGGNLCTLNLLQGTKYMPELKNTVLFLEDDNESKPYTFDRDLQSLIHQPEFEGVQGLVIGRFQDKSEMTREKLIKIIKTKKELQDMPIIADVDFGHTEPKITFPIGGTAVMNINAKQLLLEIKTH